MKHDLGSLRTALTKAPVATWSGRLTRRVEFFALTAYQPPMWLYTSGKAKRFNPLGVHCIYFAADSEVARMEYEDIWQADAAGQPCTEFHADVNLQRVLDLTSAATLKSLKIKEAELLTNWRRARRPPITQLLGQAVHETKLFSAIRYVSIAAVRKRKAGVNFVIFRDALQPPEFVRIVGGGRKTPLQEWPEAPA